MLRTNLYSLVVIKSIQLCVYVKPKLEHINASELLSGYSIILTPASTETYIIFPLLELYSVNGSWWKSVIMRSTYHVQLQKLSTRYTDFNALWLCPVCTSSAVTFVWRKKSVNFEKLELMQSYSRAFHLWGLTAFRIDYLEQSSVVPQTPLISQPAVLWLATAAIKKYLPFCTCKQWFCIFIPWPCSAPWHGSFWHSDI